MKTRDSEVIVLRSANPAAKLNMSQTTAAGPHETKFEVPDKQRLASKDKRGSSIGCPKCLTVFIQNLAPVWFTTSMGTGIVSILLHNLPYNTSAVYWLSVAIFICNFALFFILSFLSILRYTNHPGLWTTMLRDPTAPMFLGAFPMALSTIIEMISLVCVPVWGDWAAYLSWALWWIDSAMSIFVTWALPFIIMTQHVARPAHVTAIWLLPMASAIVSSAVGGFVAEALPNPKHAFWTVVVSYVLWGAALPLSLSFLVIYLYRLTVHHIPPRSVIISTLIPVAPLGQGAFAIFQLGKVADATMQKLGYLGGESTHAGTILYVFGWLMGLILWAFGLSWLSLAIVSICKGRVPFNMSWWALTFPLGVWASAAISFGNELPSPFFKIIGMIVACMVTLLWAVVTFGTLKGMYAGHLLLATDFEEWMKKKPSKQSELQSSV